MHYLESEKYGFVEIQELLEEAADPAANVLVQHMYLLTL